MEVSLPWDLLLVCAAALILISVAQLHVFIPGAASIRPALLVSVVALLVLALNYTAIRSPGLLKSRIWTMVLFIFAWAVLAAPFALYKGHALRFLLDDFLRTGALIIIITSAVRNVVDLRRLLGVYAAGAIVFAVMAQGSGFRDFQAGRYDANDAAMLVVAAIPIVAYFAARARLLLVRVVNATGFFICISGVILAGSRGGFLALIVVLAFCLLFLGGVKWPVRAALAIAATLIFAFSANDSFWDRMSTILDENDYNRHSITGRQEIWKRGIEYTLQNPIAGVGIDNFQVAEGRHPAILEFTQMGRGMKYSAAHSVWIQVGAELGLPGLLAYLLLFVAAIRFLWYPLDFVTASTPASTTSREYTSIAELARPLIGMLIGIAIAGTFLSQAYSPLFWIGFALVLAVVKAANVAALAAASNGNVWRYGQPRAGQNRAALMHAAKRAAARPATPSLPAQHRTLS
jgi:putative inorganic carbon (hco3(-)) transporter